MKRSLVRTRPPLGRSLDPRHNSLNFLRLCLATGVIVDHAFLLDYEGLGRWRGILGTACVYGFFGISGYLITRSAQVHTLGRYLWLRCLRILPGFWVALVMTAFFFGPLVWLIAHHGTPHASLSHYLHPAKTSGPLVGSPSGYVASNWFLKINQEGIAGVMSNSSLWTLFYEFVCYLIIGLLAFTRILIRPRAVVGLTALLALVIVLIVIVPGWSSNFNVFENWMVMNIMKFMLIFLIGSLCYLYRDRLPDSGLLALVLTALAFGSLWVSSLPSAYFITPGAIGFALLAYPVLWMGAHLRFVKVGVPNDYSYGVYLYGFPVQLTVLAIVGAGCPRLVSLGIIIAATVPFAMASWWGVERSALKLRSFGSSKQRSKDPASA